MSILPSLQIPDSSDLFVCAPMSSKSAIRDVPHGKDNPRDPRKRKRSPSVLEPPSPSIATQSYSGTLEKGKRIFQAVVAPKQSHRPKKSKMPMHTVSNNKTSRSLSPTRSKAGMKPRMIAPTAWKFHSETGMFVTTVPINLGAAGRPNISKPRYHQKHRMSEPSRPPDDTPLTKSSRMPSPMATEQQFFVQYPNYAERLDKFSVENRVSRHARRRAAAAQRWDRDVIPALVRPYMKYMCQSQRGQSCPDPLPFECSCNGRGVLKQVTAVYMDRKYTFCSVLVQVLTIHLQTLTISSYEYVHVRLRPSNSCTRVYFPAHLCIRLWQSVSRCWNSYLHCSCIWLPMRQHGPTPSSHSWRGVAIYSKQRIRYVGGSRLHYVSFKC